MDKKNKKRVIGALSLEFHEDAETVYPPSEVDSSAYEPMEKLIARHARGEMTPRFVPQYGPEGVTPEEAIAAMDITQRPGFDLADASEAERRGAEAAAAVRDAKREKEAAEKAAEKERAVKDAPAAKAGATGAEDAPAKL